MVLYNPTSLITIIGLGWYFTQVEPITIDHPTSQFDWSVDGPITIFPWDFWPWGPRLVDVSFAAAGCNVVWRMLTPEKNDDWQVREGIMGVSRWPSNSWFNGPEAQRHLLVYLRVNWFLFWPKLEQAWFLSLAYNKDLSNNGPVCHQIL